MGRSLKISGQMLLAAGFALIAIGYVGIAVQDGWQALRDIANPWNPWNAIAIALTLAPGAALIWLGDSLAARKRRRDAARL